jgi:hypothetical protein
MAIDVGYLLRRILKQRELSDESLCGMLAYCSGRNPRDQDMALANAYAFLSELHHLSDGRHAYPGDAACDIPASTATPFSQTYLVHLGENLEPKDFARSAEMLASYIYRNACTPTAAMFDAGRGVPEPSQSDSEAGPTLRTFGLSSLGFSASDVPQRAVDDLCRGLIKRWKEGSPPEPAAQTPSMPEFTAMLAQQFAGDPAETRLQDEVASRTKAVRLDPDEIVGELHALLVKAMDGDPGVYLHRFLGELVANFRSKKAAASPFPPTGLILEAVDALVRPCDAATPASFSLAAALEETLKSAGASRAAALRDWVLAMVASPSDRLDKAQKSIDGLLRHMRGMSQQMDKSIQTTRAEIASLAKDLHSVRKGRSDCLRYRRFFWRKTLAADPRLVEYFQLRLEETTLRGVFRVAETIFTELAQVADRLRIFATQLNGLANEFRDEAGSTPGSRADGNLSEGIALFLSQVMDRLKSGLLKDLEIGLEGELRLLLDRDPHDPSRAVGSVLRRKARAMLHAALQRLVLDEVAQPAGEGDGHRAISLAATLAEASPRLSDCGGARRLLAILPEDVAAGQLLEQLGSQTRQKPTVVTDPENDVLLCYEAEGLPIRQVAAAVLAHRFHNIQVADQLHTRIDVPWTPL